MDNLNRRKNRLTNFDYKRNFTYFVTICTDNKKCILAKIRRDNPCGCPQIKLTTLGMIAENLLQRIVNMYDVKIDEYVIMPNHIHILLHINANRTGASPVPTLSNIIWAYKSIITNEYMKICNEKAFMMGKIWQRSYYDHIIRDDEDYYVKANYINNNPYKWIEDKYYEKNLK